MEDYKITDTYGESECEWLFGGKVEKERCGAYGAFTLTNDLSRYTKAALFGRVGKKTHVLLTFSEVFRCRDPKSCGRTCACSIKFFTADGIWDLVGCNHPVAFACHPRKYSDCVCVCKRREGERKWDIAEKWDTWSVLPDSLHQIMFLTEDCGIPRNYRHMHGFACQTYQFINKNDQRFLIKFHFLSQQDGMPKAEKETGKKYADYFKSARYDLYDSIRKGNYPKWKMYLQIMSDTTAGECSFNPYDPTKTWPQEGYPLIEVGTLELNSNPRRDSQEVSLCHFSPFINLVPGIELPEYAYNNSIQADYYQQPGTFFRRQCLEAQRRLIYNVTGELSQVPEHIRLRATARFYQADEYCGKEIAKALRADMRLVLEEVEWQKEADRMPQYV